MAQCGLQAAFNPFQTGFDSLHRLHCLQTSSLPVGITGNSNLEVIMPDQMKPMGGDHPGKMPKAKTGGSGGKSPKHVASNQRGKESKTKY